MRDIVTTRTKCHVGYSGLLLADQDTAATPRYGGHQWIPTLNTDFQARRTLRHQSVALSDRPDEFTSRAKALDSPWFFWPDKFHMPARSVSACLGSVRRTLREILGVA